MANQEALNSAMLGVTQDAVLRNVNRDLEHAMARDAASRAHQEHQLEHTVEALAESTLKDEEEEEEEEFDDDPELRALEQKRLAQMKALQAKKLVNQAKGHGEYREIVEEEFLKECCSSDRVVVHFFHNDFSRCKIVDKHLGIISKKYTTCKFLSINADKAPFFVTKLAIRMLPTILVFHEGVCKDRVVGFEELGGEDDFPTRTLEVRLHHAGAIYVTQKTEKESAMGFAHTGTCSDDDDSEAESDDSDEED